MTNDLSQQDIALPLTQPPLALTKLIELIAGPAKPAQLLLLKQPDQLEAFVQQIHSLTSEAILHIHTWHMGFTPDMQDTLTKRCHVVSQLAIVLRVYQKMGTGLTHTYQRMTDSIENMNTIFHRLLYEFIPASYTLPDTIVKMEVNTIAAQCSKLKSKHASSTLLHAMLRPVYKIIHHPASQGNNTKEKITYIKALIANISLWSMKQGTEEQLYEIVIAMNLNCPSFLHYIASRAHTLLLDCTNATDRLKNVAQLEKQYLEATASTQWNKPKSRSYNNDEPHISESIDKWLSIQYRLVKEQAAAPAKKKEESLRVEIKESALFFSLIVRIQVAAGLFALEKFAPVVRTFSQVIFMRKAEVPSSENMVALASLRVTAQMINRLIDFFEKCLSIVYKLKLNKGKFPDEGAAKSKR